VSARLGHVVLVGLPGAGKTRAGALAARALGRALADVDALVEAAAGRSVAELFAAEGEAGFRARERAALLEALAAAPAVIATGGGAVCDAENVAAMRAGAVVIHLDAPVAVLAARLARDGVPRPLLAGDAAARLAALAAERAPLYARARHARVDATGAPDEVAAAVCAAARARAEARVIDVRLAGGRGYPVEIVRGGAAARVAELALAAFAPGTSVAVVADPAVAATAEALAAALRGAGFDTGAPLPTPAGEAAKTLDEAGRLADALVARGLDRQGAIVAAGGGATTDLAGFVASILFRGVAVAHVPTTLLAQVDAAIGGKTGVNRPAGKNVLGTFHQPRFVLADVSLAAALPPRERASGLAEALKCGAIADAALFALLERCEPADLADPALLVEIVARAVAVKAAAVSADPHEETGARRLLNFGHTLGHAIESEAGPERLRHGEAVGLGMALAARAGERLAASDSGLEARLRAVLARLGLPDDPDPWVGPEVLRRVRIDKKRQGGEIELVLVRRPGEAARRRVPLAALEDLVAPAAPQRRQAPKTL